MEIENNFTRDIFISILQNTCNDKLTYIGSVKAGQSSKLNIPSSSYIYISYKCNGILQLVAEPVFYSQGNRILVSNAYFSGGDPAGADIQMYGAYGLISKIKIVNKFYIPINIYYNPKEQSLRSSLQKCGSTAPTLVAKIARNTPTSLSYIGGGDNAIFFDNWGNGINPGDTFIITDATNDKVILSVDIPCRDSRKLVIGEISFF